MSHRRRAGRLAYALQDLLHTHALRDVALGAEELGLPLEAVRGEDEDRDGGALRVAAHALHHAPAVEHRHLEVEQDDARLLVGRALQRHLPVLRLLHGIAGLGQHLGERLAEIVVVVDDEDVLAGGHGAPFARVSLSSPAISLAMRRASRMRSGSRETAPTTGCPPPPYRSQIFEMSWVRGTPDHGFE